MKILICNDDGYQADGIVALYEALRPLADVEVIAPQCNNSAKSNALTLNAPLYVQRDGGNGFRYVNGTPADCVHIALTGLLDYRPDLVVSGINNGANMGDDTLYSGTVGAAMEGYLFGIPSIAFSLVNKGWQHLDAAAVVAHDVVQSLLPVLQRQHDATSSQDEPYTGQGAWLLNVNIPNRTLATMQPVRLCRLGRRHAADNVISQQNPRGEMMYWIGNSGPARDAAPGTDFHATSQGHVAITPLQVDLTDYQTLGYWGQALGGLSAWGACNAAV